MIGFSKELIATIEKRMDFVFTVTLLITFKPFRIYAVCIPIKDIKKTKHTVNIVLSVFLSISLFCAALELLSNVDVSGAGSILLRITRTILV